MSVGRRRHVRGRARRPPLGPRRLAELSIARPRRVVAIWAVLFLVGVLLAAALLPSALITEDHVTNNPESQRAQRLIDQRLPDHNAVDEVVIVRSERALVSDPDFMAHVRRLVDALRRTGAARGIRSYLDVRGQELVARDRHATIIPIALADKPEDAIEKVVPIVERARANAGFADHITGKYTAGRDFHSVSEKGLRSGELRFGLPAALIVLLLVFGTLVGAGIPLLMATLSIVVGLGLVAVVGQAFELNVFIVNMLVAMGLALGIDYSLFIVSRLREERARQAILNVASTATRAVVFSGAAFVFAMCGMLLVPQTALRSLAVGAIVVGVVSVGVALTFHPALLMLLGDRVNRLRVPWLGRRAADAAGREGRFWGATVRAVMRRPTLSLVTAVLALLIAASPLLALKLGSGGASSLPDSTVAKQGLIALQRDFPSGATAPVRVVVDGRPSDPRLGAGLERLRARLARDPDFAARAISIQTADTLAVLSVPLTAERASERASAAIDRLRHDYVPTAFDRQARSVEIGGGPAETRDYFAVIGHWLPLVIAFVLALSFIVLTLAFRSIVVPLTAIAVNLLSVGAAYGLLVLVFQKGLGAQLVGFGQVERIEAWVPLFLFSVLFGLSMDYQVFLLSRIHEHYRLSGSTEHGIVHGVGSTARLITGAALIIVAVFSGLAGSELVSFQQMGFGVAIALLIDATIVRSVVIPAAMRLLGDRNWYLPRRLEWLPKLQIEGPPQKQPQPAAGAGAGLERGEQPAPETRGSRSRDLSQVP
jgi:putative drug exporter of the RND superfamily